MEERNNFYVAKTLRMMNFLAKKYDVIRVVDDFNNKNRKVFLFNDSDELRDYLKQYKHTLQTH